MTNLRNHNRLLNENLLEEIAHSFLFDIAHQTAQSDKVKAHLLEKQHELIPMLVNIMKQQGKQPQLFLTPQLLSEPNKKNRLFTALSMGLHLRLKAAGLELNPGFDKDFQKELANLLKDPKMLKKLASALKEAGLGQQAKELLSQAKMKNSPELKPGGGKQKDAQKEAEEEDPYQALLGILTSKQAGCLPIVVQCFLGNGLGIADYNPNRGGDRDSQLDEIDSAVNELFGDFLGIDNIKNTRSEGIAGSLENMLQAKHHPILKATHYELHDKLAATINRPHETPYG